MTLSAFETVDVAWRAGLAPDPDMTVTQWADAHRMLPATAAEPGRWRTARTPYAAEIMDALSPASGVERVVVMAAAQVSKTEIGLNFIAASVALWPGLTLHVSPTTESARRMVRTRVDPMIEATPELTDRIVTPGPRKAGNSAFFKSYPGGAIAFVGANSGVGLRSTPARFVVLDEVDAFPHDAGGEGDPVQLAIARTATFRGRRKILMLSTPTLKGFSRIEAAYEESDQRRLFVPCPECREFQPLTWSGIVWPEGAPEQAHYVCSECGSVIEEKSKPRMLAEAEWRATADGDGRTVGFHITGLASPFTTWTEIATDFLAAKASAERLQVWTNTALGDSFEDRETAPLAADTLQAKAENPDVPWSELLPDGALVLTCGVDTQDDRLELEIVAWGLGEESWSVDYQIIAGDTSTPEPWNVLDRILKTRYAHPRAVPPLPISATCIDAGGHRASEVAKFSGERLNRRVWQIRGRGGAGVPAWPKRPPKPKRGGVAPLFTVGVDTLKSSLMARLRSEERRGPAVCHLPADRDLWWFMGLVAERAVRKWRRGVPRMEWVWDRSIRNEPLDARVYGTAALHGLYAAGLSLRELADKIGTTPVRSEGEQSPSSTPIRPRVLRSKWVTCQ